MPDNPKRLTRAFFKRHGKQGGLASGARKSRGDREYYAELGRKAAAAKKAKKSVVSD
jgi:general stress protein YciG